MSEIVEYFNFLHIYTQRFFSQKKRILQSAKADVDFLESRKIKIGTAVLQQMRIKHGMAQGGNGVFELARGRL